MMKSGLLIFILFERGNNLEAHDFISLMMKSGMTDEEIQDQSITFFFAAHDTTASTICWVLYYLVLYPEYQEKMREKLRENNFSMSNVSVELHLKRP